MPNPYFSFKQFTVYQDKCAMKVGTDGVLLGAWASVPGVSTVLDIGTGTGLIALMISQRTGNSALIDAIDIDEAAILQAKENTGRSNFRNIHPIRASLQDYATVCKKKYDLIVSNPPYFTSSLHSPNRQRTLARHTDTLPICDLVRLSATLMTDNGRLALIYPYSEKQLLTETAAQAGLYTSRLTHVYPTPLSAPKRLLIEFTKTIGKTIFTDLIIETERHIYSPEFIELVKDFYLKM